MARGRFGAVEKDKSPSKKDGLLRHLFQRIHIYDSVPSLAVYPEAEDAISVHQGIDLFSFSLSRCFFFPLSHFSLEVFVNTLNHRKGIE